MNHEIPNPEKIKEMLEAATEKIPALIEAFSEVLYSKERAKSVGEAVGAFYKELIEAGMSSDEAYKLTKKYISDVSPKNLFKGKGPFGEWHHHRDAKWSQGKQPFGDMNRYRDADTSKEDFFEEFFCEYENWKRRREGEEDE